MRTYLRMIRFDDTIFRNLVPYFIFSILGTFFGIANFALLIPLLELLFNPANDSVIQEVLYPENFEISINYFQQLFYFYFYQILNNNGKWVALQFVVGIIVGSVFFYSIFNYLSIQIMANARSRITKNLRTSVFKKLTSLEIGYFTNHKRGDVMARMTTDISYVEFSSTNAFFKLIKEPIRLISFLIALLYISIELTVFTLLVVPVAGVAIGFITRSLKKQAANNQKTLGVYTGIIDEVLDGFKIIKSFNAEKYIIDKFERENNYLARLILKMSRTRELASPVSEFLGISIIAGVILYGGSLVISQNSDLTAGAFIAYIILVSQIINPGKAISTALSDIQQGIAAGERIFDLLDTPSSIQEISEAVTLKPFNDHIEFKNVFFRYKEDDESEWVLNDINFNLEKGKTIALVGQSGGGKTTIANLLPRFYDIQKGEILIDGVNIKNCTFDSLTSQIGLVTQEAILFNDTIFNNIAFANPNATQENVEKAAQIANAHEFIIKTENGYQTEVGDRGMKLSGGQRQRISIARAILKNPPILILDEATSALDTESEKLVQEALNKLMANRTSLVIAHRLSTIQNADLILVMDRGEIIERGKHEELLRLEQGIYQRLYSIQFA